MTNDDGSYVSILHLYRLLCKRCIGILCNTGCSQRQLFPTLPHPFIVMYSSYDLTKQRARAFYKNALACYYIYAALDHLSQSLKIFGMKDPPFQIHQVRTSSSCLDTSEASIRQEQANCFACVRDRKAQLYCKAISEPGFAST